MPPPPQNYGWGAPRSYQQPGGYNPSAYHGYQQQIAPPPPPPPPPMQQQVDNPPLNSLTSATYVPDGRSFGPGVGIPPLHNSRGYSEPTYGGYREDNYSATTDSSVS